MGTKLRLRGAFTALVTPFSTNGSTVDVDGLAQLVSDQIAGGISGLVPVGTTGESPTLSDDEQVTVIRETVKAAAGRVPVIAGTGSNSTHKTIAASRAAVEAGADAIMVVTPYYNKPSQAGLIEHFVTVAKAVDVPVVLYNVPSRSVVDVAPETVEAIFDAAPNFIAIKEATGNIVRAQELKRRMGDRITVLCGDDGLTLGMMAVGADGVISVTSNVRPAYVAEVPKRVFAGDFTGAQRCHLALLPLHGAMFLEPNPAPAKAALDMAGKLKASVRGPLLAASPATREHLRQCLSALDDQWSAL